MKDAPILVKAFGGGLNSTAVLCGFRSLGIRPDLILFADTGAEHPHTYSHVQTMDAFTRLWWGVGITVVRKLYQGRHEGLEGECLRRGQLPALAYGRKACSVKHKIEPQTRELKQWMQARGIKHVRRAIGYDAGEARRMKAAAAEEDLKRGRRATNWYPLIEWGWNREKCRNVVDAMGIPVPGKSACFFCPSSKRSEVIALSESNPALFSRAIAIEDNAQANLTTRRGLGGAKNLWRDWLALDEAQPWLDLEPEHKPCGCID